MNVLLTFKLVWLNGTIKTAFVFRGFNPGIFKQKLSPLSLVCSRWCPMPHPCCSAHIVGSRFAKQGYWSSFFFFVMGHAQVVSYGWAFSNNHNFRCLGRGFRTGDRAQRANLQPLRPSFQSLVQLLQQSQLWTDAFLHWPSPVWEACLDCGFCHSNVIALSCYSLGYFFFNKTR